MPFPPVCPENQSSELDMLTLQLPALVPYPPTYLQMHPWLFLFTAIPNQPFHRPLLQLPPTFHAAATLTHFVPTHITLFTFHGSALSPLRPNHTSPSYSRITSSRKSPLTPPLIALTSENFPLPFPLTVSLPKNRGYTVHCKSSGLGTQECQ